MPVGPPGPLRRLAVVPALSQNGKVQAHTQDGKVQAHSQDGKVKKKTQGGKTGQTPLPFYRAKDAQVRGTPPLPPPAY